MRARHLRIVASDIVYHILNRANGRDGIFQKDLDYAAFEKTKKRYLTPFLGLSSF